jgi:hypothetical protein
VTDERELERITCDLEVLEAAVIDASSMIYLGKLECLQRTATVIELWTVPPALREVGFEAPRVVAIDVGLETADDALLELAVSRSCALISEDRKLLARADRSGLRYYNTLMILALLVLRGNMTAAEYHGATARLPEVTRYHPRVTEFGLQVARYIMMNR